MDKHFTATAFVINSKNQVLLMWHKRLNRWMPPGGHIDENEAPEDAAVRECKEETGLDIEIISDTQEDVFLHNTHEGQMMKKPSMMLLENIPESIERNEPAHQHMDFVYMAKPVDETQVLTLAPEEGDELRWFGRNEIESLNEQTEVFANVKNYLLDALDDR